MFNHCETFRNGIKLCQIFNYASHHQFFVNTHVPAFNNASIILFIKWNKTCFTSSLRVSFNSHCSTSSTSLKVGYKTLMSHQNSKIVPERGGTSRKGKENNRREGEEWVDFLISSVRVLTPPALMGEYAPLRNGTQKYVLLKFCTVDWLQHEDAAVILHYEHSIQISCLWGGMRVY